MREAGQRPGHLPGMDPPVAIRQACRGRRLREGSGLVTHGNVSAGKLYLDANGPVAQLGARLNGIQ